MKEFSSDLIPACMLVRGVDFAAAHMGKIAGAALVKFGMRNDDKGGK